jgi:3alpha(or 20beta)-hydroxysteroid dehydrogenase
MRRLDGKVALVTGAARGTGAEIARRFVAEGARVVVTDLRDEAGVALADSLGEAARYRHLDVTADADWQAAVDELRAREGRLDVLVNNAAVLHLSAIEDTPPDVFETVLRVNCTGPFLGTRACLPLLRADGGGSIVNVGSVNSLHAFPGNAGYTASKFGLRGLTRVTALENGRHGVRANLVCPLMGNPEMHGSMIGPRLVRAPEPGTALRPFPSPPGGRSRGSEDVVGMVVFLASDESLGCSGADFVVDLGLSAGSLFDIPGVFSSG